MEAVRIAALRVNRGHTCVYTVLRTGTFHALMIMTRNLDEGQTGFTLGILKRAGDLLPPLRARCAHVLIRCIPEDDDGYDYDDDDDDDDGRSRRRRRRRRTRRRRRRRRVCVCVCIHTVGFGQGKSTRMNAVRGFHPPSRRYKFSLSILGIGNLLMPREGKVSLRRSPSARGGECEEEGNRDRVGLVSVKRFRSFVTCCYLRAIFY